MQRDMQRVEADELFFNNEGCYRVTIDGKSGLVDEKFQMKWPVSYDYLGPVENHQVVVKKNKKFGLLRLDKAPVLPIEFDSLCAQGKFYKDYATHGRKIFVGRLRYFRNKEDNYFL